MLNLTQPVLYQVVQPSRLCRSPRLLEHGWHHVNADDLTERTNGLGSEEDVEASARAEVAHRLARRKSRELYGRAAAQPQISAGLRPEGRLGRRVADAGALRRVCARGSRRHVRCEAAEAQRRPGREREAIDPIPGAVTQHLASPLTVASYAAATAARAAWWSVVPQQAALRSRLRSHHAAIAVASPAPATAARAAADGEAGMSLSLRDEYRSYSTIVSIELLY